eukprot:CAMPEP_0197665208 /NCGR_PEP_ID=MMETSP1338-20131121/59091_1 /TAXON_ID=43686 ORGANISM="Pelagodinium beii, Strain RCC1491" /NCGR_SAMPLE_ID=MMETSP1338 /ASSEMBLY_ACC=CAM_ASM_000754 /LENGTH=582 /DNA_ID=CAMNT_0043243981 /DNA_START=62 /DNA_END=1810 /DNA_ORIENTATION=-
MSMSVQSAASSGSGGERRLKRIGWLHVPVARFNPSNHIRELARMLEAGLHPSKLALRPIGLNNSVWILSCAGRAEGWLIKQVPAKRRFSGLPTDLECCDALISKFPGLLSDQRLAFPHSVVHLQAPTGEHVGDLIISRQAPGVQLGRFLAELDLKNKGADQEKLERVCSSVGELLADFHTRYADPSTGEATHHTDFHPSNVLYDEKTGALSIVDLTGMGSSGINDDVEKFARLMGTLAGERYAAAFQSRYIALAKPSLCRSARSSTRSTAASSTDGSLLYPPTSGQSSSVGRGTSFQCLSSLVVPGSGFNPEKSLTTLAWLLSPGQKVNNPVVRPLASCKDAWVLSQSDQKECWILQQVSSKAERGLGSIADRCEALASRFPELLRDDRVAFPHRVIPLQENLKHSSDLLVCCSPCSVTLQDWAAKLDLSNRKSSEKLNKVLFKAGQTLAILNAKYANSHWTEEGQGCDLHPKTVLYDEQADIVCFADFSGCGAGKTDEIEVMSKMISAIGGSQAWEVFNRGYTLSRPSRSRSCADSGMLGPWFCVAEIAESECEVESQSSVASEESDAEEAENKRETCSLM